MRNEYFVVLTDACTAARLRVRPELITEIDAAALRLPSGDELPVAIVKLMPRRNFDHVETAHASITVVASEPASWIREAVDSIEATRARNRRNGRRGARPHP
jgi:hypothetical protein